MAKLALKRRKTLDCKALCFALRDWLLAVELTDPEGKQVFVVRAHSRNALEGTGLMIPILVDAMFADFPAASGETRRMVLTAGRNGEG